jgi:hypothetical protein
MNKNLLLVLSLFFAVFTFSQSAQKTTLDSLLAASDLEYIKPDSLNLVEKDVEYFRKIPHQYCLGDKEGTFEIRIYISPLKESSKEYQAKSEEEQKKTLDPNKYHNSMINIAVLNASNNVVRDYSLAPYPDMTKEVYNADWQAMALVPIPYDVFPWKFTYIDVIHKKDKADVYIYYLTNSKEELYLPVGGFAGALRFK